MKYLAALAVVLMMSGASLASEEDIALNYLRNPDSRHAIELHLGSRDSSQVTDNIVRAVWPIEDGSFLVLQRAAPGDIGSVQTSARVIDKNGSQLCSAVLPDEARIRELHFSREKKWPGLTFTIDHGWGTVFFPANGNGQFEYIVATDEDLLVDADAEVICSNAARRHSARLRRSGANGEPESWARFMTFDGRPVYQEVEAIIDDSGIVVGLFGNRVVVKERIDDGGIVLKSINLTTLSLDWEWSSRQMVSVYPIKKSGGEFNLALMNIWEQPEFYVFDFETGVIRGDIARLSYAKLDANGGVYGKASMFDHSLRHFVNFAACYDVDGNLRAFGVLPEKTPFLSLAAHDGLVVFQYYNKEKRANWTALYDFRSQVHGADSLPVVVTPILVRGTWNALDAGGDDIVFKGFAEAGNFESYKISKEQIAERGAEVQW